MGYILYSSVFVLLIIATIAILLRTHWVPLLPTLPGTSYIYSRLPSSFQSDIESGLSSSTFDLHQNLDGDERAGLDAKSKAEILKIMKRQRVPFDEARRIYTERRFGENNIGPDGRPRDPKFVSFS